MGRRAGGIVAGAVIGLIAGALAPVVFIAACVWDGRAEWSALTESESVPYIATLVALGAVNGAVGAWDGWRSSLYRVWPVAWVPALLFLFPAVQLVQYPSDSKTWGAALLVVGIVAPFVWVAGRVGQEVGVRVQPRHVEPGATPDTAI
ncbi:hypothetical protein GobsT_66320 [Gemmata obscuriglobus]|uniref:Uncharacterized protein n=1 Tax=Gemmata obscuriglobus TaxID=114 RepID=A0A2Z3GXN3_9BACT|nr:hypothetical protein [Gemmata obscuriglobus]AWM35685.1 hypothetical protein C1280_00700 [Gemmata obscuriglobus]QEG31788.1 hypothetical protein GobsT_66320 [Gemmata obscuriglobus]VTS11133.1 unnamed protein product [Gemmata obscuriglobus UQM 2246]